MPDINIGDIVMIQPSHDEISIVRGWELVRVRDIREIHEQYQARVDDDLEGDDEHQRWSWSAWVPLQHLLSKDQAESVAFKILKTLDVPVARIRDKGKVRPVCPIDPEDEDVY